MGGKAGLLLIQVNGDDVKGDGGSLAQVKQDIEQGVAVFAVYPLKSY